MSAEAVGWVWRYSPMEKGALLVHLAIADVVNDMHGNQLWSSLATLGRKARVGRTTVVEALDAMCADGLLTLLEKRPGHTDLYQFEWPELPVQYSDRRTNVPVRKSDPPVRELDPTGTDSAHELNRTQADNYAQPKVDLEDFEWVDEPRFQPAVSPEEKAAAAEKLASVMADRFGRRKDLA